MTDQSICSIEFCDKPRYGKGYCRAHYTRLCRHGDPLGCGQKKTPNGEPLRFIIEFAAHHSGDICLPWPYGKTRNGYGKLDVDGKRVGAHRYVCEFVHGAPPTQQHETAHGCGNPSCVNPNHLRWATRSENETDKIEHGTSNRGETNNKAKLTESDVRDILALKGINTKRELADRFGVSWNTIDRIHRGESWAWLAESDEC